MNDEEYIKALHLAREIVGLMIEDGCDAVVVSWSSTKGTETTCRHMRFGNYFACFGLARKTMSEIYTAGQDMDLLEAEEVEDEEDE